MADAGTPTVGDPSPALTQVFDAIGRDRMADVPILNPRLTVEAVGFREWNGHWLGTLVTPWFINLVVTPADATVWRSVAERETVYYAFPTGVFAFIAGNEPGIGEYHACSLFSPVLEFADQETARETARLALEGLFDAALLGEGPSGTDGATAGGGQPPQAQTMSRRNFLRGATSGTRS
jgi:[NiFe] hydrogenase assembly HybE family chaperone